MESIAEMAITAPNLATELLDKKVIDTLIGIIDKDSSKFEGPSDRQLKIRGQIISGKTVSDADKTVADKTSPMEIAEKNKQYAMFTLAILDNLYGSEIEKLSKSTVPVTELPGALSIIKQVKTNPNPMVRAAGIDALSYLQKPEYKDDLSIVFTLAQKDRDPNVQKAANIALDKLNKLQSNNSNLNKA